MKIYLAAPLFSLEENRTNHAIRNFLTGEGHEVFLPQELPEQPTPAQTCEADLQLLNSCQCVVAVCNGAEVDSGTAFEIGYAYAKGMKVVLYRSDRRPYFNKMLEGSCPVFKDFEELAKFLSPDS